VNIFPGISHVECTVFFEGVHVFSVSHYLMGEGPHEGLKTGNNTVQKILFKIEMDQSEFRFGLSTS
jgi:hypothetical protein